MKVLVIGGAGYIGIALCEALKSHGHSVTVIDYLASRSVYLNSLGVRLLVSRTMGIMERTDIIQRFDVIFNLTGGLDDAHLFGLTHGSIDQACATLFIRGATKLARIVHVSTQYVYSAPEMNKERAKPEPKCDYGLVQSMAESVLSSDDNSVILRFGTVWGKGTYTRYDTWGNHLYAQKEEEKLIDINYPKCMICMLSLSNAVGALEWAISANSGIYNVADQIDFREEIALQILGDYPYTNRPFTDNRFSIGMDCNKIKRRGFKFEEIDLGFDA